MDSRTKDAAEAGRKRNLVLLDLVPGEESGQNDGADQERDHPVHVTHCCPLSMVCGGKRILLPALSRYGLLHFILLEGKSKGSGLSSNSKFGPVDPKNVESGSRWGL